MQRETEKICDCIKSFVRLEVVADMLNYVEGEAVFLRALIDEGKKSSPSVMADKMGVSKGRITALIIRLSDKGLVKTAQSVEDGRKTEVHITEEGEKFVADMKKKVDDDIVRIFDKLGKGKALKLLDLMQYAVAKSKK